jgi:site-specific DNA-methyltransferase (adenine-specific)
MFSSDIENDDHEHEVNNDWEGWGTALKPAHEPIVMARKPISEKSIADNVLKHGTGAINIDACRVEGDDTGAERKKVVRKSRSEDGVWTNENSGMKAEGTEFADADPRGRFPANVMHNGLEEDWARYFYCAKTSKSEKGKDNNHPTVKPVELMKYLCRMVTPKGGTVLDIFMGSGSTGMAAKDEGFDFIGIEKDKEYFQIAEQRIKVTAPLSEFMK